jgi:dephospho-CoA kinase
LLQKGTPTYKKVVKVFGKKILNEKGEIVRSRLGKMVFADFEKLKKLNRVIHPTMVKLTQEEAFRLAYESDKSDKSGKVKVVVIDAALLIEVGLHKIVDWLLVVTSSREEQVKRIVERSKRSKAPISEAEAERRIESQLAIAEKVKLADYVIDNSGSIDELKLKVDRFWEEVIHKRSAVSNQQSAKKSNNPTIQQSKS